ncbi:MAG: class I SAM-dependent methyltransferase [Bacteroidota bacterium]|nr:class I SAM-dependent methyltransferase [Ferruginibacter sp.]
MNIDNQHEYWDRVAQEKTFSHPVNTDLLNKYISPGASIVDFGCGYGRVIHELQRADYQHIKGFDTSMQLVQRGKAQGLPLHHIPTPADIPVGNNSVDCILLFAVLTCIPSNKGQAELLYLLNSKLKPGGILYISDYYLQQNEAAKKRYTYFNSAKDNFGVFSLPEGVMFRHHTKGWIKTLLKSFELKEQHIIPIKTMNGNTAEAFQLIAQKPA